MSRGNIIFPDTFYQLHLWIKEYNTRFSALENATKHQKNLTITELIDDVYLFLVDWNVTVGGIDFLRAFSFFSKNVLAGVEIYNSSYDLKMKQEWSTAKKNSSHQESRKDDSIVIDRKIGWNEEEYGCRKSLQTWLFAKPMDPSYMKEPWSSESLLSSSGKKQRAKNGPERINNTSHSFMLTSSYYWRHLRVRKGKREPEQWRDWEEKERWVGSDWRIGLFVSQWFFDIQTGQPWRRKKRRKGGSRWLDEQWGFIIWSNRTPLGNNADRENVDQLNGRSRRRNHATEGLTAWTIALMIIRGLKLKLRTTEDIFIVRVLTEMWLK